MNVSPGSGEEDLTFSGGVMDGDRSGELGGVGVVGEVVAADGDLHAQHLRYPRRFVRRQLAGDLLARLAYRNRPSSSSYGWLQPIRPTVGW